MGGLPCGIREIEVFDRVKDIPSGEGYGVSSHKYELSEEIPMSLTIKQKQAVTKQLAVDTNVEGRKRKGRSDMRW